MSVRAPRQGNPQRGIRVERGRRFARRCRLRPIVPVRSSVPGRMGNGDTQKTESVDLDGRTRQ
jgi:hypothetical protein